MSKAYDRSRINEVARQRHAHGLSVAGPAPAEFPEHERIQASTAYGGWWGRIVFLDGTQSRAVFRGFPSLARTAAWKGWNEVYEAAVAAFDRDIPPDVAAEVVAVCRQQGTPYLTHRAARRLHERTGWSPDWVYDVLLAATARFLGRVSTFADVLALYGNRQ